MIAISALSWADLTFINKLLNCFHIVSSYLFFVLHNKSLRIALHGSYGFLRGNYLDIPGSTLNTKNTKESNKIWFRHNMQSFLSSLTPELQITTFWNVCHVFLGTSTTKCGHESNNAPQSFFFFISSPFCLKNLPWETTPPLEACSIGIQKLISSAEGTRRKESIFALVAGYCHWVSRG